jgi:hypothetical protein
VPTLSKIKLNLHRSDILWFISSTDDSIEKDIRKIVVAIGSKLKERQKKNPTNKRGAMIRYNLSFNILCWLNSYPDLISLSFFMKKEYW